MILGIWLDQPVWLIFALLAAVFAVAILLIRLILVAPPTRAFCLGLGGVVAPFFGSVSVLLALLTGFVANDAWERQRQAVRVVQSERDSALATYDLSIATVSDMSNIRTDLAAYLDAVVTDEWVRMQDGESSPRAGEALGRLLQAVAAPQISAEAGPAAHNALLTTVLRLRAARGDRLSLAQNTIDQSKWLTLMILAGLTLVALALVHLDKPRAQIAAMVIFSAGMVSTLGLVALHERPFDGPIPVSAAPLWAALAQMAVKPAAEAR
ncbi:bestrophin-like domain [Methylobacterium sp. ID0610]|uniref:bestrophin-like domain n=1 Tax=Methylobacterium carpenticola TaxID=3344827 RepID=UPI0036BC1AF1